MAAKTVQQKNGLVMVREEADKKRWLASRWLFWPAMVLGAIALIMFLIGAWPVIQPAAIALVNLPTLNMVLWISGVLLGIVMWMVRKTVHVYCGYRFGQVMKAVDKLCEEKYVSAPVAQTAQPVQSAQPAGTTAQTNP
jgi:hypothetical protein